MKEGGLVFQDVQRKEAKEEKQEEKRGIGGAGKGWKIFSEHKFLLAAVLLGQPEQ